MSSVKKCAKCGIEFTCELKHDCWCSKIELTKEQRVQLKNQYLDCLCNNCLIKISENKKSL